jgi:di/tricarboxylate transporter
LLGGIVTLIGTSPNIIIARVRAEITGQPFGMFDFTPVGLSIALLGLGFLLSATGCCRAAVRPRFRWKLRST